MVKRLFVQDFTTSLGLKAEGIGGDPLYLFISSDKKEILYSFNLKLLLEHPKVKDSLFVSDVSVSHMLQCGVIPPPISIFNDLYVLGIGDSVKITRQNDCFELKFKHQFPYTENYLDQSGSSEFDLDRLLYKIAGATRKQTDANKQINLFHTAGKDSNMIALALKEHFEPDQVRLVCHQSEGSTDESEISRQIAEKLGFEHLTIKASLELSQGYLSHLENYFEEAPFPLLDNVTLAFPEYAMSYPDLARSNIVTGDGNDTYMMAPPILRDEIGIQINKYLNFNFLRNFITSENPIAQLTRTPFEWARMSGFNERDTELIFNNGASVRNHWNSISKLYRTSSALDIKSHSYGCYIIYEVYIRKFRHYSQYINSTLAMPFSDSLVANEITQYNTNLIVDKKRRRNKPIFREVIKDRLGVDTDAIGKKGYSLNTVEFIYENKHWIYKEIVDCKLWNNTAVKALVERLYKSAGEPKWSGKSATRLIYRLLLISLWHRKSKYIQHNRQTM